MSRDKKTKYGRCSFSGLALNRHKLCPDSSWLFGNPKDGSRRKRCPMRRGSRLP